MSISQPIVQDCTLIWEKKMVTSDNGTSLDAHKDKQPAKNPEDNTSVEEPVLEIETTTPTDDVLPGEDDTEKQIVNHNSSTHSTVDVSESIPEHKNKVDVDPSLVLDQDSSEDDEKLVINEGDDKHDTTQHAQIPQEISARSAPVSCNKRKKEPSQTAVKKKSKTFETGNCSREQSNVELDQSIVQLKKELQTLELLLQQKEDEWNDLLHLQKKKEELCRQLLRRRKVSALLNDSSVEFERDKLDPFISLTENQNTQPNVSIIDIHTSNRNLHGDVPQILMSPTAQEKLGQHVSVMKSLKSPPYSSVGRVRNPPNLHSSSGFGPQGPTVSVHQLIAAHRKDNPKLPPIRGAKRGAWRHRYDGDKSERDTDCERLSSTLNDTEIRINNYIAQRRNAEHSPASADNSNNVSMDPSVSYKDVLVQFAQMTQKCTGSRSASPQISITPVSNDTNSAKLTEPICADSTSVSYARTANTHSEGRSALAKLLLETQSQDNDFGHMENKRDVSSQFLTLSTLLSSSNRSPRDKASVPDKEPVDNCGQKSDEDNLAGSPKCQGCHSHKAQFVCAGCGNQWYCSRTCQVDAWDDHADLCHN